MKKKTLTLAIFAALTLVITGAGAQEDGIVDYVGTSCETEITTFCSQVTPGEGRLLACFYAHGDQISVGCEYALYTSAVALDQFVSAVATIGAACEDDLLKYCGDVEVGEGRVADCLLEHQEETTETCQEAIAATGLEVVEE